MATVQITHIENEQKWVPADIPGMNKSINVPADKWQINLIVGGLSVDGWTEEATSEEEAKAKAELMLMDWNEADANKTFEIEEDDAYHGGAEVEAGGIHFLVVDNQGNIDLLVDENEYAEEENQFDWSVRRLMKDTDFSHTDAYGNPGDTFEVMLTLADVEKAKRLIAEYQSLEADLED